MATSKTEDSQSLWRRHKYSVLARDERGYRQTGRAVARGDIDSAELAARLDDWLSRPPPPGGLRNAIEHMWGHVSNQAHSSRAEIGDDPFELLTAVRREAERQHNTYLLEQTALSELFDWRYERSD